MGSLLSVMLSGCQNVNMDDQKISQVCIEKKVSSKEECIEEKGFTGEDEPQPVQKYILSQKIHRSIGGLTFNDLNKRDTAGSGVLLSENLVLTAAHNLYDKQSQQEFNKKSYRFYYKAKKGIARRFYRVAEWIFPPQYITCKEEDKFQFDYALVRLEERVDLTSFPLLALPCEICLDSKNRQLGIFGYPIIGKNYTSVISAQSINFIQYGLKKQDKITFFEPQGQLIKYRISTQKGHSGSPVIFDGKIIGVHTGYLRSQDVNIGKLVTKGLLNNLTSWAKQLKGERFVTSHCVHVRERKELLQDAQPSKQKGKEDKTKEDQGVKSSNAAANFAKVQVRSKKEELLQQAQTWFVKGSDEAYKDRILALNYFGQCLQIQTAAVGKGGRETADTINWIGKLYYWQNDNIQAINFFKQCISIKEKYSQERDHIYLFALTHSGLCFEKIKDFKSGAEYFKQRLLHNQQIKYLDGAKQCAKWLVEYSQFWGGSQRAEELKQKYKIKI